MNQESSHLNLPSQFPPLHKGEFPEQASLGPHLHTPVLISQLSVVPEQSESPVHGAIE